MYYLFVLQYLQTTFRPIYLILLLILPKLILGIVWVVCLSFFVFPGSSFSLSSLVVLDLGWRLLLLCLYYLN
ncbi:unnamed protein product [Meloidogyne enterolobii]|uniref:Uncharacterized protein n=1 Tax=Meloidogyne enterolobii TaxID=390850 RepID=A0ACB0YED6_MELEN